MPVPDFEIEPVPEMTLATVASAVLNLESYGVAVVGQVPSGLPHPHLPAVTLDDVKMLLLAGLGVTIVGFALSRSFVLSVALLAVGGAADMLSINFRSTMVQVLVPPSMLGRVSAVNQIFIGS